MQLQIELATVSGPQAKAIRLLRLTRIFAVELLGSLMIIPYGTHNMHHTCCCSSDSLVDKANSAVISSGWPACTCIDRHFSSCYLVQEQLHCGYTAHCNQGSTQAPSPRSPSAEMYHMAHAHAQSWTSMFQARVLHHQKQPKQCSKLHNIQVKHQDHMTMRQCTVPEMASSCRWHCSAMVGFGPQVCTT